MNFILRYHLLPFLVAAAVTVFLIPLIVSILPTTTQGQKSIVGDKVSVSGYLEALTTSEQSELELIGSLQEKTGITLLASSELSSSSQFVPFRFLPDSLGIRVNAFGHAFQQSFSIYCQLLALKEYLKDARITIILSPEWFKQGGTNIEAFLEFVRPNFLKRIITDSTISKENKFAIGRFVAENYHHIQNPNLELEYFNRLYRNRMNPLGKVYSKFKVKQIDKVQYKVLRNESLTRRSHNFNWEKMADSCQRVFTQRVTNNNFFISDEYFASYLQEEHGTGKTAELPKIELTGNQELEDFKLLVRLLQDAGARPSFLIQGLNPYFYSNPEVFDPIVSDIITTLKKEKIPFLNLYTSNKAAYRPGLLYDVMHTGDLGWVLYNEFLIKVYE